ncbi:MAG: helix-turn-helix transcriptional regulator [Trueperaceae bacterium]|nr:helix-turn-helix transcriptional regulator [Trueperaceae bacterium]
MSKSKQVSEKDLLPLTPAVFHILLALAAEEKHGYAIMKEVEVNSKGQFRMGPGTLYGSIKRMLELSLIEETDERPDPEMDDQRRRYYKQTPFGAKVLKAELQRFNDLMQVAKSKGALGSI